MKVKTPAERMIKYIRELYTTKQKLHELVNETDEFKHLHSYVINF